MPTRVWGNDRGVTVTELMVAMAIITIGVLAGMTSFQFISASLSQSRLKTIATNLAQEKMEVLKNKNYFQLQVTTSPVTSTGYTPSFVYDNGNYPSETITLWGGAPLTRAVEVDYASPSPTGVSTVSYSSNDTGMKKITVYVFWTERGTAKKVSIESYYQNSSVETLSTGFLGNVTESGSGTGIPGAIVQVIGTPKWRGISGVGGAYNFQVAPGSYTLVASSAGFFSALTTQQSVTSGLQLNVPFSLIRIASGTVSSSNVYTYDPNMVISQVVASTVQADGFDAQYVELFNPTTAPINIGSGLTRPTRLNITSTCGTARTCTNVNLTYVSTYAAPGRYYLIASRPSLTIMGNTVTADAYYSDPPCSVEGNPTGWDANRRIIQSGHNGVVALTDAGGAVLDAVGWGHDANTPVTCEGTCIAHNGGASQHGLLVGDQIVRFSTACAAGTTYGRAYDTDNNANNFYYNNAASAAGFSYRPFSSADAAQTVLSGRPSTAAYVFASDGNSPAVQSSNSSVTGPQGQSCAYSSFTLVGVATGTWSVTAAWGSNKKTITGVVVTAGAVTAVPNAATTPAWPVVGLNYAVLSSTASGGFASGLVYGSGSVLNGILVGSSNGGSSRTDSAGRYVLSLPTGTVTITANYNSDNGNYTTANAGAAIAQGAVTAVPDLYLAQGGYIKGYATSGTGALPNISVRAVNGGYSFQNTTDITGYFYIFVATASSVYNVTPDLDPLQSYTSLPTNPLTATVSVPGATVFTGTITVIGAMGTIAGSVKDSGSSITTGVLVVASTAGVPTTLLPVVASSSPALATFYAISSQADGTYSLDVRSSTSTTYNVRAYYPVVDIKTGAVTYTSKSLTGISVGAGVTVSNQNFTWP